MSDIEILRATIFHTPEPNALVALEDGGLVLSAGKILACEDYATLATSYPDASVRDLRGGFLLPGFIDTHVHYPQVRIIGGLGHSLLDWLDQLTLPEEARLQDDAYATSVAGEFVNALAAHGTTTALVFGSHFATATATLFTTAQARGVRVFSGLVLADRLLRPELHQTPDAAYRDSQTLLAAFRANYVVMPRFALSASEPMLEVCATLLRENPGLRFTSHINENGLEIDHVAKLFPWAEDYLAVYERFGLVGPASVLAHNVHATDSQLHRLAAHKATVAHCPCSNAALGSGIFPWHRHRDHGVRIALGTDVGGGTGFGMMKEALQVYLQQRVAPEPVTLSPAEMLYLATRAGAEALNLGAETGDFSPGKAADLVYLQPRRSSVLAGVLRHTEDPHRKLAALFTLAGQETIREVQVAGKVVFRDA